MIFQKELNETLARGWLNVPAACQHHFPGDDSFTVCAFLGTEDTERKWQATRTATLNRSPRIFGNSELGRWLHQHFRPGECVTFEIEPGSKIRCHLNGNGTSGNREATVQPSGGIPLGKKLPPAPGLEHHFLPLAQMVAETSLLPDPATVKKFQGAVFPTVRDFHKRITPIKENEKVVGMYDDNTTPRWAFLWSHGISDVGHPKGWHIAHIWPSGRDINAYTHLANLIVMPECFGNLSDKIGPLTSYLRWHSRQVYGWGGPKSEEQLSKPPGYDEVQWNYLSGIEDPRQFIRDRLAALDNQRIRILRPLMGN